MRLPWLQMDTNVFPRLDSLAGLLGIERAHAYGLAANLWMWAIDWGPSDAPPSGEVVSDRAAEILSAGVRWTGNPDVLVRALRDIGLIADIDGGIRVKGMDRYAAAWAQQDKSKAKAAKWREQKRKWREANTGQVADKSRTSSGQTAKTETEKETDTEKEENTLRAEKPPAGPRKPEQPPDPRHAPMVAALTAIYAEETRGSRYAFGGRDAKAVQRLLRLTADDDEVHFKWRTALRASFDQFHTPKTRTIPELVRDWNAYTAVKAGAA